MSQQVNLYTEEFWPRREKLQASTVGLLCLLAVFVVVVVAGVLEYRVGSLEAQSASLSRLNEGLQSSVDRLSAEVGVKVPDPEVVASLERVSEALSRRQRMLGRIEALVQGETEGFSATLTALGRQVPAGLWLTMIELDALTGNVVLAGNSHSGSLVPAYLERLGTEEPFAGRSFGAFRLEREQGSHSIGFRVATRHEGEDD